MPMKDPSVLAPPPAEDVVEMEIKIEKYRSLLHSERGIKEVAPAFEQGDIDRDSMLELLKFAVKYQMQYGGRGKYLQELKEHLPDFYETLINDPEVHEDMKDGLVSTYRVSRRSWDEIRKYAELFNLSREDIIEISQAVITKRLGAKDEIGDFGHYERRVADVNTIELESPLIVTPYAYEAAVLQGVVQRLNLPRQGSAKVDADGQQKWEGEPEYQWAEDLGEIRSHGRVSLKMWEHPEIQSAMLQRANMYGISEYALDRLDWCPLSKEFCALLAVNKAAINKACSSLQLIQGLYQSDDSQVNIALHLKWQFGKADVDIMKDDQVICTAEETIKRVLLTGEDEKVLKEQGFHDAGSLIAKIKENFVISPEFLSSEEYLDAFKTYVINLLNARSIRGHGNDNYHERLVRLLDEPDLAFFVSDEQVHLAARDGFIDGYMISGGLEMARKYLQRFSIPLTEVFVVIEQEVNNCLCNNDLKRVLELQQVLSLSSEYMGDAMEAFIRSLMNSLSFERIKELKEKFALDDAYVESVAVTEYETLLSFEDFSRAAELKVAFSLPDAIEIKVFETTIRENNWERLNELRNHFDSCFKLYDEFVALQKSIANNFEISQRERTQASIKLAGLAEYGNPGIVDYFVAEIKAEPKEDDTINSRTGMSNQRMEAFTVLYHLDNPDANGALFNLLTNQGISSSVKRSIAKRIFVRDRNFMDERTRLSYKKWLESVDTKDLDFEDLSFASSVEMIPSADLRAKARDQVVAALEYFGQQHKGVTREWIDKYSAIPRDVFMQLYLFTSGDPVLMAKFQKVYEVIEKQTTLKNNLLFGVVNMALMKIENMQNVLNMLWKIEFGDEKDDAVALSDFLRQMVFIDAIDRSNNLPPGYSEGDLRVIYGVEETQAPEIAKADEAEEKNWKLYGVFSRRNKSLKELVKNLGEVTTEKIQAILPNKEIIVEKITAVMEQWSGDLEPIFTYLARYPQLRDYISEMMVHFDTAESWQEWRYSLANGTVKDQVGFLSPEQLAVWQENHCTELGDIAVAESGTDKPAHIRQLLVDAVLRDKHLGDKQANNQARLEETYKKIGQEPEKSIEILESVVAEVEGQVKNLDVAIQFGSLPKVKQALESFFLLSGKTKLNAKTKSALGTILSLLPKDIAKNVLEAYQSAEGSAVEINGVKEVAVEKILSKDLRKRLAGRITEIEKQKAELDKQTDLLIDLGLKSEDLEKPAPVFQKRQELKALLDILRLSSLSNKLIATNRISEKVRIKEGGETILSVIENLKKQFKGSAFEQDLNNIEFSLKERRDYSEKRRLAMIVSDNPQILWQAGKYPLGCGSCQNYESGCMAESLLGYVGDAHIKVMYLLDINKLPEEYRKRMETEPVGEVLASIPATELLPTTLARSIIKLAKTAKDGPAVYVEPIYSSVYKADLSMDRYFEMFTKFFVSEPMNAKLTHGVGSDLVKMPSSRNQEGQYEDGAMGGAANGGMGIQHGGYFVSTKFIEVARDATPEEAEIAEKMRRSSYSPMDYDFEAVA